MTSNEERIFVTSATGDISSGVVRGLIKKGINTTAYVRDEKKANDLFKTELESGHLKLAIGDYSSVDAFTKAIQGHTRLFLLYAAAGSKPADMSQVKGTLAKIAFEQGVRQVVDLSSAFVTSYGKRGIIGYMHTAAEEKLWALADEKPDERSLVVLRPGAFMSNHLHQDIHQIKRANKIVSCGAPSATVTWIDTRDISECAVVILSESIEKHDRNAYDMGADALSQEQRAAIFSKVLGKTITYEQQSVEDFYKTATGFGMSHSLVYNFLLFLGKDICVSTTPEISVIIGRPLRTLEQWLQENVKAFQ